MPFLRVLPAICLLILPAIAQPAFEVASIKPSPMGPNGVRGSCHGIDSVYTPGERGDAPPLGRCVITDARLSHLIGIAWKLPGMQMLQGGPDWVGTGTFRYDVVAKTEDTAKTTEAQLLAMLQALLIERFQLKFHRVPAETDGFALVVDKGGSKLQPSKGEDFQMSFGKGQGKPRPDQPVSLTFQHCSISTLLQFLSGFGGQGQGIDKTGLDGLYDFSLSWDDEGGVPLPAALRQQLGLRMERQKVPVSYFVVDSAQKPSAN